MMSLFQSNYKSMVQCLVLMEGRLVLVSPAYLKQSNTAKSWKMPTTPQKVAEMVAK